MLLLDQIKEYYSEDIFSNNKRFVLLEYIQYELLDSIFKSRGSEYLSFMGETAIRIVYQSSRFSEDLDFDNFGLSFKDFEHLLEKVVSDMKNKGFEIEYRMVEKGAYHCYIKFPNILQKNDLIVKENEKILVRIDTVAKNKRFSPRVVKIDKLDVYRDILVDPADIILSQKIVTVLERKRPKGRDFYDMSYLLGITDFNFDFLKEISGPEDQKELKERLLKKCGEIDFRDLAISTQAFLLDPEKDRDRILSFPDYIEQKF